MLANVNFTKVNETRRISILTTPLHKPPLILRVIKIVREHVSSVDWTRDTLVKVIFITSAQSTKTTCWQRCTRSPGINTTRDVFFSLTGGAITHLLTFPLFPHDGIRFLPRAL